MKNHLIAAALVIAAGPAFSQPDVAPARPVQIAQASQAPAAAADLTEGEVRKVDKEQKKVTIKHGEIKNLDMPPMTMVFAVSDPAMIDKIKAGDRILFRAAELQGKLTLTELQAAR